RLQGWLLERTCVRYHGRDSFGRRQEKRTPPAGGVECAGEDLNLHGRLRPLGPQPSASTNSATSARGTPSVAAARRRDGLRPALPKTPADSTAARNHHASEASGFRAVSSRVHQFLQ